MIFHCFEFLLKMINPSFHTRRRFLKNIGYISIGFSLFSSCVAENDFTMAPRKVYDGDLPVSMKRAGKVNSWLEILADGRIRVFSGKVELGQGIRTAVRQVAAEELDMELEKVEVYLAETGVTPNEGYTAASASIKNSAMSVRYAAATARKLILSLASEKLNEAIDNLTLLNGIIRSKGSKKSLTIQELLNGTQIETEVTFPILVKSKKEYKYVGKAIPRMDIPKIVSGELIYIQDLRFPDMVHARVVRPPNYKSKLLSIDDSQLKNSVAGVIKTVVNGNFVGVITESEFQSIKAEQFLKKHTKWSIPEIFPKNEKLYYYIRQIADAPKIIRNDGNVKEEFGKRQTFTSTFTKPYIKHGSVGPACAIAMYDREILHIWSHSQGIYPLREAIASMLQMDKEKIHIVGVPGAGCFGHSTADDAAADASLLALAYPGKHIRVQWSHNDEFSFDPYGSAIIAVVEACLDNSGKIQAWKSSIWTDSHSTRPNKDGGTLLAARYLKNPIEMQSKGYLAGGHRNGTPYYNIPHLQLNAHYFDGPLRVSSLRSLGAFANIFAIESFMDELAEKAGKDVLDFRLEHLDDKRALDIIHKVKDLTISENIDEGEGIGYGFMRYKNTDAYASVAAKASIDLVNGHVSIIKLWAAVDVGEVINMDGIKNQIEGGMIQAASWTLKEQVMFNDVKVTSTDWSSYPVFRYSDTPEVEVAVINRPNLPAIGGGEVVLPPTSAAIANAVYKACGKRIYDLPITPQKIISES